MFLELIPTAAKYAMGVALQLSGFTLIYIYFLNCGTLGLKMQIKEDIVRIEYWFNKIWPYQLKKEQDNPARCLKVTAQS